EAVIEELEKSEQILYRYCNSEGLFNVDYSPNGSINNIAGICNRERNVFAMMPHPERACSTLLGNTDGRQVFSDLFSIN
ncbi:MAG: phosphoribosylformylglycinamidine synthase subunit PurQ, partial [Ginsengibacter sp.]